MANYTGTHGVDIVMGNQNEPDIFTGFGILRDIVTGGSSDDVFYFAVDQARDSIDGGGGRDLLDYTASDRAVDVDLNAGHVTALFKTLVPVAEPPALGGGIQYIVEQQSFVVADVKNIEDVTGSNFDDTIVGNDADNTLNGGKGDDHLSGGAGANTMNGGDDDDTITLYLEGAGDNSHHDTIDGGSGNNTLNFSMASADQFGVSVSLQVNEVSSIHVNGAITHFADEATIAGIENVTGTDQADVIQGDGGANILIGNGGDDVIDGGAGADYLDGGDGNDQFLLLGDRATDEVHGGNDIDTAIYTGGGVGHATPDASDHAVTVTLADNGDAGTAVMFYTGSNGLPVVVVEDHLYDIENVIGSDQSDTLTGNSAANVLLGGFGEDHLNGNGGADVLNGGPGHDILTGGAGADNFQFSDRGTGANADTITDFKTGTDHIDFSPFYSQAREFHNFHLDTLPPPTFIGDHGFSGAGNELRVFTDEHGSTIVQLQLPSQETNDFGDTVHPDIEVNLGQHAVHATDFSF